MKKKLQKIKKDLCFIAKENAPAFLLAIIITSSAIFISQLLYRTKPMIKRGYEIEIGKDGKPVAKKIEKVVESIANKGWEANTNKLPKMPNKT